MEIIHITRIWDSTERSGVKSLYGPMSNPKYGIHFVTLKWIKKGEVKGWPFYQSIIGKFAQYGKVTNLVLGPDSLGRPHVHFKFAQDRYFSYKKLIPKYTHINFIPYKPYHDKYIRNHTLI